MSRRTALVVLGHGSHLNADSSAPVYAHAARIRAAGTFDEVLEAFWKEEPSLRDALFLVDADDVVVVPLFLAEGYFTREVLPRELGISGPLTVRGSQRIHYAPPVGTHPSMAGMIVSRAAEPFGDDVNRRARAALVIIGHGTDRSATSGDTVYALVDQIRALGEFGIVECGFLDESPAIGDVLAGVDAEDVVLVPFFVAEGWHTRETIPADLGLTGDVTRRGNRTIWYTPPVGTMPGMPEVVVEIAEEARRGGGEGGEGDEGDEGDEGWVRPIRVAREVFFAWVDGAPAGGRTFLQLRIEREPPLLHSRESGNPGRLEGNQKARYSLRPALRHPGESRDPGLLEIDPADALDPGFRRGDEEVALDAGVPLDDEEAALDSRHRGNDGGDLRARALEIARYTDSGAYRPLRTAPDLRGGWSFTGLTAGELWEVVSIIYPGAVLHWYLAGQNALEVVDYRPWAARQTAMYEILRDLTDQQVGQVVRSTCGACLRRRLWKIGTEPGTALDPASGRVPCREPCTLFATDARTLARPRDAS